MAVYKVSALALKALYVHLLILCVKACFCSGTHVEVRAQFSKVVLSFCPAALGAEHRSLDLGINVFTC